MSKSHFYDLINPKVEANLIYKCAGCQTSNYMSIKEAKVLQKFVCLGCNAVNELKPIRKIRVNIEYESAQPISQNHNRIKSGKLEKEKDNNINPAPASPDYTDVLDCLVNLGYNRKSAAAKIEKAVYILGPENSAPSAVLEKAITL